MAQPQSSLLTLSGEISQEKKFYRDPLRALTPERAWHRILIEADPLTKTRPIIESRLRFALQGQNGMKIPMHPGDLFGWLVRFYKQPDIRTEALSRSGHPVAYIRDQREFMPWEGEQLGKIRLPQGPWKILSSDESRVVIPESQTLPLRVLTFKLNQSGKVFASYDKSTPIASVAKQTRNEGSTSIKTQEGLN